MKQFSHSKGVLGFVYLLECFTPDGKLKWRDRWENIIPDEGRDYILNAAVNGGSQFSTWYAAIYEGAYTPQADDTAANIVARATETTVYTPTTRPELVDGALDSGLWANVASPVPLGCHAGISCSRPGPIRSARPMRRSASRRIGQLLASW